MQPASCSSSPVPRATQQPTHYLYFAKSSPPGPRNIKEAFCKQSRVGTKICISLIYFSLFIYLFCSTDDSQDRVSFRWTAKWVSYASYTYSYSFKLLFVYLNIYYLYGCLGLSCGTWGLWSLLWHDFHVPTCSRDMWNLVPWKGIEPRPPCIGNAESWSLGNLDPLLFRFFVHIGHSRVINRIPCAI